MSWPIVRIQSSQNGNDNVADCVANGTKGCKRPTSDFVNDNEADGDSNELQDIEDTGHGHKLIWSVWPKILKSVGA